MFIAVEVSLDEIEPFTTCGAVCSLTGFRVEFTSQLNLSIISLFAPALISSAMSNLLSCLFLLANMSIKQI